MLKMVHVNTWGGKCLAYAIENGPVRVYDPVADRFTSCHTLTPAQERYVRAHATNDICEPVEWPSQQR